MPDRELKVVAKDLSEHALKILVGIIDAPGAKVWGYPVIDSRDFPLEVQERGSSASHRTMNPAPSSFGLKVDSLFLPNSSRREFVGRSCMPNRELDHILNRHSQRRVFVG